MTFRTAFTLVLFVAFVLLCGYELAGNIAASAQRSVESVRCSRGLDAPPQPAPKGNDFDMDKILENTDVNG